jgi:hypothetical protein
MSKKNLDIRVCFRILCFDETVKGQKSIRTVIPAKAGIQLY